MRNVALLFAPTGKCLYDCALPAVVWVGGVVLAMAFDLLSLRAAGWAFVLAGVLHLIAGLLATRCLKKDGRENGKPKRAI